MQVESTLQWVNLFAWKEVDTPCQHDMPQCMQPPIYSTGLWTSAEYPSFTVCSSALNEKRAWTYIFIASRSIPVLLVEASKCRALHLFVEGTFCSSLRGVMVVLFNYSRERCPLLPEVSPLCHGDYGPASYLVGWNENGGEPEYKTTKFASPWTFSTPVPPILLFLSIVHNHLLFCCLFQFSPTRGNF